jgi:hypothetical protein
MAETNEDPLAATGADPVVETRKASAAKKTSKAPVAETGKAFVVETREGSVAATREDHPVVMDFEILQKLGNGGVEAEASAPFRFRATMPSRLTQSSWRIL